MVMGKSMTPEQRRPFPEFDLKAVAHTAKEVALRDGGHLPLIIAQGDQQPILMQIPHLPATHEERRRLMFAAGQAIVHSGELTQLNQVVFISEGWMSVAQEDGTFDLPPSQDPNRREVLVITSLKVSPRQTKMIIFEMLRDSEEQLMALEPLEVPDTEERRADSPLLDAVVAGFYQGRRGGSATRPGPM